MCNLQANIMFLSFIEKWVDTESDGTEEVNSAPPTDSSLGRSSPAVQTTTTLANGQPVALSGGNLYSLKSGRRSKYVDVMGMSWMILFY